MKAVLRKALDALLAVTALLPLLAILSMLAVLLMLGFISWQENHVSDEWLIHAMETRLEESIPDEEAILVRDKRFSELRDYHLELLMTVKASDAFDKWTRQALRKASGAELDEVRKSKSILMPEMAEALEKLLSSEDCLWKVSIRKKNGQLDREDWLAFDPESRTLLFLAADF